ncbi:MAG: ion channel [Ferroplasma sp.]
MRIFIKIKRFVSSNVFRTIVIFALIVIIGSYAEYYSQAHLAGSEIKSPLLAIWFVFQTVTTVGYGDVVPINEVGMIIAIIIMLAGIGVVTALTAATSAYLVNLKFRHKIKAIRMKNHTIICNYNDYSASIINDYLHRRLKMEPLVLISNKAENPVKSDYVSFVSGDSVNEKTLLEANAPDAKRFIVTGDFSNNIPANMIDAKTILNIFQIRKLNKDAEIIAQVAEMGNVENAKGAGADQVITLNELSSLVISKSIENPNMPDFILKILSTGDGPKIYSVKVPEKYIKYKISDFIKIFTKISILSIYSNNKYVFPVDASYSFNNNDIIYFLSDEDTIKGLIK